MPLPFRNLQTLIARIDAHSARVIEKTPLNCRRGCSACCHVELSVTRIEADYIQTFRPSGSKDRRRSDRDNDKRSDRDNDKRSDRILPAEENTPHAAPCIFLDADGACSIYEVRPIICRTHGLPLQLETGRDICPLNQSAAEGLPLNLELLNQTLTAIDLHYCRETNQTPKRIPLADLARRGDEK